MKEAGYEWDDEKKELKKIMDEIEIPFGAKDSELQEVTYYIPKGFHAEIYDDKVVIKKGDKPTWVEEDENKPNGGIVMEDFNDGNGFYKVNLAYLNKEQVKEIEELVERWDLQPKVSEDKSIISDLLDYFNEDKCLKHEVNDIVKWLKTINPQQKGWSENEINMLDNLITYLGGRKDLLEEIKRTYIDWLKSLKDRVGYEANCITTKEWKPSNEQIGLLQAIVNEPNNAASESCQVALKEIIKQMKKLKE
jgi:hypothetical protein